MMPAPNKDIECTDHLCPYCLNRVNFEQDCDDICEHCDQSVRFNDLFVVFREQSTGFVTEIIRMKED